LTKADDLKSLRSEFCEESRRNSRTVLQEHCEIVEQKLAEGMLARNRRWISGNKYESDRLLHYNREKDDAIEESSRLVELVNSLDREQKRATKEGHREG